VIGDGSIACPTMTIRHLTRDELDAGLDAIRQAPRDEGVLELIVRRPAVGEREILDVAELSVDEGLTGDGWRNRGADPEAQVTVMGARTIALIAQDKSRWPLAGDQLFVDLNLAEENVPPGTRLAIGCAVIEVSPEPHTGCRKFVQRFGVDAMKFVNSPIGRQLHLRGLNTRVVRGGTIRAGDRVRKVVEG
jgi:MOSC domain-containing protein YiiM